MDRQRFQVAHARRHGNRHDPDRCQEQALLDAGADHVVAVEAAGAAERVNGFTGGNGARVVFDPIGGPLFELLTRSMARGGILLEYGALSPEATPFPHSPCSAGPTLKGFLYTEIVSDDAALEAGKAFITDGLAAEELNPVIARTFSLDQIQDAHRFLESNEQVGK